MPRIGNDMDHQTESNSGAVQRPVGGERRTLKAWYVYEGEPSWYTAMLILENGAAPYSHICSDPYFMPGDLWTRRPERQEAMRAAGITLEIQGDPIHIRDLPGRDQWLALNKNNRAEIDELYALLQPPSAASENDAERSVS